MHIFVGSKAPGITSAATLRTMRSFRRGSDKVRIRARPRFKRPVGSATASSHLDAPGRSHPMTENRHRTGAVGTRCGPSRRSSKRRDRAVDSAHAVLPMPRRSVLRQYRGRADADRNLLFCCPIQLHRRSSASLARSRYLNSAGLPRLDGPAKPSPILGAPGAPSRAWGGVHPLVTRCPITCLRC